jgi:hypothetical protein
MPNALDISRPPGSKFKPSKRLEVLVVQGKPADTLLTIEAFKAAGLTERPHCVAETEALKFVLHKGKYGTARRPELILLRLSQPTHSGLAQNSGLEVQTGESIGSSRRLRQ